MSESSNVAQSVPTTPDAMNEDQIDEIDEDLLDSAFEDIKDSKSNTDTAVAHTSTVDKEKSPGGSVPSQKKAAAPTSASLPTDESLWSEEYFQQMTQDLEKNMESFVNGDTGQLDSLLEQMMNTVNLADLNAQPSNGAPASQADQSLEEKLKASVEELTEGIKNLPMNNFANMMRGSVADAGGASGEGASANMLPFLEDIMQQFLSKDVLYPVFSETVAKYPDWLAKNKPSLKPAEYKAYEEQHRIMAQVVKEFDAESPRDSGDAKKARFNRVLALLQEMQAHGSPPKDLVGEDSFPSTELAAMGGGAPGKDKDNCSIM